MIDESNRNNLNRNNLDRTDSRAGMGNGMIALIAAVAVMAVLFMWAPWNSPRVADNVAPGTTVGSSTRPSAPMAPTTAAPAAPAVPPTTR